MPRASRWPSPEQIPQVGGDDLWPQLQETLEQGLRGPLPGLDGARRAAGQARELLEGVLETGNQRLGVLTCSFCPQPCCVAARVWLDLADLLVLHLAGLPIPPAQLRAAHHQSCRYLGPRGCRLPRTARPFVCTWYHCPTQMARRGDLGQGLAGELTRARERAKFLRREITTWYRDLL